MVGLYKPGPVHVLLINVGPTRFSTSEGCDLQVCKLAGAQLIWYHEPHLAEDDLCRRTADARSDFNGAEGSQDCRPVAFVGDANSEENHVNALDPPKSARLSLRRPGLCCVLGSFLKEGRNLRSRQHIHSVGKTVSHCQLSIFPVHNDPLTQSHRMYPSVRSL